MRNKTIRLSPAEEAEVKDILRKLLPEREVWVFGSRAGGNPKPYSDLDLLVGGERSLPVETLYQLKEAFDESDLPFQVDVIEWSTISDAFRKIVAGQRLVLQEPVPTDLPSATE